MMERNNISPNSNELKQGLTVTEDANSLLEQYRRNFPNIISSFACANTPKELPADFVPCDYDVSCGRGKGSYGKPGNIRFRSIVKFYSDEYVLCRTKTEKTACLNKIVTKVKEQNGGTTRFVSFDTKANRWYEMSMDQAREKVGHALRVSLTTKPDDPVKEVSKDSQSGTKQSTLLQCQAMLFQELTHSSGHSSDGGGSKPQSHSYKQEMNR